MLVVTKALAISGVAALAMSGAPLPDSTREGEAAVPTPVAAANSAALHCPGSCNLWGMLGSRH